MYILVFVCNFAYMKKYAVLSLALAAAFTPSVAAQTVEESVELGKQAFLNYNFEAAASHYAAARKKAKKNIPAELEEAERELLKAENFLGRVEKIVILDSIAVPKADFFKAYRLPSSAGNLGGSDKLPFKNIDADYVFTNEGNDFKMWAEPDSAGNYTIRESIRLTDGSWSEPTEEAPEILNNGANAIYPFMMSDGVTLYFANDSEDSLGGYDIYVATRDAADGEYMQPQNLGMPYNSPYDDYLLAIDELNGVGWWATDRNQLDDLLTIYLFKVNDVRRNYESDDTEYLASVAWIDSYRDTWEDEDYSRLLEEIQQITPDEGVREVDFILPMKGGVTYYTFDDFSSASARRMMQKYLSAKKSLDAKTERLSSLRRKYASGKSLSLKSQILALEAETEKDSAQTARLLSDVYRAEQGGGK